MAKSIFEQLSGAYEQHGDYFIPYHALLPKKKPVGVYGQRHLRYLKKYRNALNFCESVLLSSCNLEIAFQPLPQYESERFS